MVTGWDKLPVGVRDLDQRLFQKAGEDHADERSRKEVTKHVVYEVVRLVTCATQLGHQPLGE
jgi:hypothetical protein